jgi:23S rRNA G2445 N2-methylase RlmL|tara:strand:- start:1006 stop:1500 length:495 start_codon:yes stop_codon:yes gene_type:complete
MVSLSLNTDIIKLNNDDDYMTPNAVWDSIKHLIPKDKIIWECFYGNGESAKYLSKIGFNVESYDIDFFNETNFKYDILISNMPYSIKAKVFQKLAEINKPFMMLVPVATMTKQYLKKYFKNQIQIIIPERRIQFIKNGKQTDRCYFDTIFICYKMNLLSDIVFL